MEQSVLGLLEPAAAPVTSAAAASGHGGVPSAPIDIAWQQLGAAVPGDAAETAGQTAASYRLEQTARAAADRILSPEVEDGPALLQEHHLQRQQQVYNVRGVAVPPGPPAVVGGGVGQGGGAAVEAAAMFHSNGQQHSGGRMEQLQQQPVLGVTGAAAAAAGVSSHFIAHSRGNSSGWLSQHLFHPSSGHPGGCLVGLGVGVLLLLLPLVVLLLLHLLEACQ